MRDLLRQIRDDEFTVIAADDDITPSDVIMAVQTADQPPPRYPRLNSHSPTSSRRIKLIEPCSLAVGRSDEIRAQAYVHRVLHMDSRIHSQSLLLITERASKIEKSGR